ncbi:hypothetical protein BGZ68_008394 [Mortierella alpina]|nr:hypothetical protein BGZ68_008394 [Mortierella alpina]
MSSLTTSASSSTMASPSSTVQVVNAADNTSSNDSQVRFAAVFQKASYSLPPAPRVVRDN